MTLKRLKELRKLKGLTQNDMAQKLGYKGKSSYCMLENGQVRMTIDTAKKIADILGEDVKVIFFDQQVQVSQTKSTA